METRTGFCIATLLMLTVTTDVAGQTVHGTALDDATHTPIPAVKLTVLNDSSRVLTTRAADSAGVFDLPLPRQQRVRLRFESIGYEPVTSDTLSLERGEYLNLEVHLSAKAVLLEPVVVLARHTVPFHLAEFYRRAEFNKKIGIGRIWTREDLANEGVLSIRSLIMSVPVRAGGSGCAGRTVLLDNLPVFNSDLGLIRTDDLEGMEIYRDASEVPLEYQPACSVVLLWRKPYGEGGSPLSLRRVFMFVGAAAFIFLLAIR